MLMVLRGNPWLFDQKLRHEEKPDAQMITATGNWFNGIRRNRENSRDFSGAWVDTLECDETMELRASK